MLRYYSSPHFKSFANSLKLAIAAGNHAFVDDKVRLRAQRQDLKDLIAAEREFRQHVIDSPEGDALYEAFGHYILYERRNILAARPYYRERQSDFTAYISPAFKTHDWQALKAFDINYLLVTFFLERMETVKPELQALADKIQDLRLSLTVSNLPLAISQARIFWQSAGKSHLAWMDLVQIHSAGLLTAVDKFVPPREMLEEEAELQAYRKFRSVAIGRMVGDRIEQASETLVHYYPLDKRKIYRANKARRFFDATDYQSIAESVNTDLDADQRTDAEEIQLLLNSLATVSADAQTKSGPDQELLEPLVDRLQAADESRPDLTLEDQDARNKVAVCFQRLSPFEQKFLRLTGVEF